MKIIKNISSKNCHFYSREKLQYSAWACFRNETITISLVRAIIFIFFINFERILRTTHSNTKRIVTNAVVAVRIITIDYGKIRKAIYSIRKILKAKWAKSTNSEFFLHLSLSTHSVLRVSDWGKQ